MMFGLSLSTVLRLFSGLVFALLLAWGLRVDHLRAHWRDLALGITVALEHATGRNLDPENAAKAAEGIGYDLQAERTVRQTQTLKINELQTETERLAKLSDEWRVKALAAIAKRDDAIRKLAVMANDPGKREDCVEQLKEAQAALDLAYRSGI